MKRKKSLIGLALVFAFVLSAFTAANASAEQMASACDSGTGAPFEYADAHCVTPQEPGKFHARTYEVGKKISITATNSKTASETTTAQHAILAGNLAGVATELTCSEVSGTGSLTNAAASVSGTGTLTYSGCSVLKPAGKECKVKEGMVTTEELAATTVGQAANKLKFEQIGTKFANVIIEGCTVGSLNNTFPVTGSLVADTSGATTTTTEAGITTQGTLKFGGNKAGLEGAITISDGTPSGVILK
jgi:hypothetical protein